MVALCPEGFVKLRGRLSLPPTCTFPKAREPGLTLNCPADTVPVPVRVMVASEFEAVLWIDMLPLTAPLDKGMKVTFMLASCPGASWMGGAIPLALKPGPDTEICDTSMVALPLPVLVKETGMLLVLPTATLPKFTLELPRES